MNQNNWTPAEQDAARNVFYAALEHIKKQGCPSIYQPEGSCIYHHPDGLQCAFAPCIENYSKSMEGDTAEVLLDAWSGHLYTWARKCPQDFAGEVQLAHDDAAMLPAEQFMSEFLNNMRNVARKYPELELKVPQ